MSARTLIAVAVLGASVGCSDSGAGGALASLRQATVGEMCNRNNPCGTTGEFCGLSSCGTVRVSGDPDGACCACTTDFRCGPTCLDCSMLPIANASDTFCHAPGGSAADADCDFACQEGYLKVAAEWRCQACLGVQACGPTCATCVAPAHGTASCQKDGNNPGDPMLASCTFSCKRTEDGYRKSGDTCVPCLETATCGLGCITCTTSVAHAVPRCATDPTNPQDPALAHCGIDCASGYRRDGSSCLPCLDATTGCGPACEVCTATAPAQPSCVRDGTSTDPTRASCGVHCPDGYTNGPSGCEPCNTTTACGAGCLPCPNHVHTQAACAPAQPLPVCAWPCLPGYVNTDSDPDCEGCAAGYRPGGTGECVLCNQATSCGAACQDCTGSPDGHACVQQRCGCTTSADCPGTGKACVGQRCLDVCGSDPDCRTEWGERCCGPTGSRVCLVPGAETCDGRDEDCDGAVDEANELLPPSCENQRGVCEHATKRCVDGAYVPCAEEDYRLQSPQLFQVEEDRCDNHDNDCDGDVDEPAACAQTAPSGVTGVYELGGCGCTQAAAPAASALLLLGVALLRRRR